MSLENLSKKELADKVRELADKLKEMKQVEAQVTASVETLKDGSPAVGIVRKENGSYEIIRLVYDLEKNAAAIIGSENVGGDHQVAAGYLTKATGEAMYKAMGLKQ